MKKTTSWGIWTASCHIIAWERGTWGQSGRNYEIMKSDGSFKHTVHCFPPESMIMLKKKINYPSKAFCSWCSCLPQRGKGVRERNLFAFFSSTFRANASLTRPWIHLICIFLFLSHRFFCCWLTLDWKPQKRRTGDEANLIYRMTAIFTSCSFHLKRNAGTCSLISDKEKHKS